MANTLTAIMPKILARGLQVLRSRLVGPRVVNSDYSSDAASFGDIVNIPVAAPQSAAAVVPGPVPPTPASKTPTTVPLPLDQWEFTDFHLTDKDRKEIDRNAAFLPGQVDEAIESLARNVNANIYDKFKGIPNLHEPVNSGLVYGGTTIDPLKDAIRPGEILNTFKAPTALRRVVLDFPSATQAKLLPAFRDVSQANREDIIIEGEIGRRVGFDWFEDGQMPSHTTAAEGAGAMTVNGAHAAGATTLSIAKATGANMAALEGDILEITVGGKVEQYALAADVTITQAANTNVTLSDGLQTLLAGGEAISFPRAGETDVQNLVMQRQCIAYATRPIASDELIAGGMLDIMSMTDPVSGLSLRLQVTRQWMQVAWIFDILWGSALVRPRLGVRVPDDVT